MPHGTAGRDRAGHGEPTPGGPRLAATHRAITTPLVRHPNGRVRHQPIEMLGTGRREVLPRWWDQVRRVCRVGRTPACPTLGHRFDGTCSNQCAAADSAAGTVSGGAASRG
ncbi:hypothetical protein GCM10010442_42190 [Kitasatospora kifunensis]